MIKIMSKSILTVSLLAVLMAAPVYAGSINKIIRIRSGATADGATSVNGSVTVGEGAIVTGEVSTVNGTIRINNDARVQDVSTVNGALRVSSGVRAKNLSTVNGSIRVDENVTIDGWIEAVNGSIGVRKGSKVAKSVSNVNGEIELVASEVHGDLATVNGDIELSEGAILHGDIIVEKPGGWHFGFRKSWAPIIVIGPDSRVLGKIRLEREVKLYISDTAEVGGVAGVISRSDAILFSGTRP